MICCRKKLTSDQKKYLRVLKKAENDLDIIGIITSLQKLKAGVSAIIKNDKDYFSLSKEIYE